MAKYLIKVTEEYRADSALEAEELITNAKADTRYELTKFSSVYKERKQKGEVVDSYYLVTLIKTFDDPKAPCGEARIEYKIGAF